MFTLSHQQFNLQYSVQLKGGLSTQDMSNASGKSPAELKQWLEALIAFMQSNERLLLSDLELINSCYYRIDAALKIEHEISMPLIVMQKNTIEKMRWYVNHLASLSKVA